MPIPSSAIVHDAAQTYYYSDGKLTFYHAAVWYKTGNANPTYKFRELDDTLHSGTAYYPW